MPQLQKQIRKRKRLSILFAPIFSGSQSKIWSADLLCYRPKGVATPHVDKPASEGVRFERAFKTSPVCSTSRSVMRTGFHRNDIRAHQHREHEKAPLPHGIRPIPHLFADAVYYTALMSWKTDCDFVPNEATCPVADGFVEKAIAPIADSIPQC